MLKLALALSRGWKHGSWRSLVRVSAVTRAFSQCSISPDLMKVLVCPLSKEPLRYKPSTNELVCDELGVAYLVLEGGIPNLVPEDGRLLHAVPGANDQKTRETDTSSTSTTSSVHSKPQSD